MAEPIWNKYLTERDRVFHEARNHAARQGFGKRPALLVIDVNYAFCGDRREPIMELVEELANVLRRGCVGCAAGAGAGHRGGARREGVPVSTPPASAVETMGHGKLAASRTTARATRRQRSRAITTATRSCRRSPPARATSSCRSRSPRAFTAPILSYLTMLGCDSVIVGGTTTSGCVRATVLDGFSYNFRAAVIEDGCFDRAQASHALNLFDMQAKYADVVGSEEVVAFLEFIAGAAIRFRRPPGAR